MIMLETIDAEKSLEKHSSQNMNREVILSRQNSSTINNSTRKQNIRSNKQKIKNPYNFKQFHDNLTNVIMKKNHDSFKKLNQRIKSYQTKKTSLNSFISKAPSKIISKLSSSLSNFNKNVKSYQFNQEMLDNQKQNSIVSKQQQKSKQYQNLNENQFKQLKIEKGLLRTPIESIQKPNENYLLKKKQGISMNFQQKNKEQMKQILEQKYSENEKKEDLKKKFDDKFLKYRQSSDSRSKLIKIKKIQKKIELPQIKKLNIPNLNTVKKMDIKKLKTQIYDEDYKKNKKTEEKSNLRDSRYLKVAQINDFEAQVHHQQEIIRNSFVFSRKKNRSYMKTQQTQQVLGYNYKKLFNNKNITDNIPIQIQQKTTQNKFKKLIDYSKLNVANRNTTNNKLNDNVQNQTQLDLQFLMTLKQNQTVQVNQLLKKSNIQKIIQNVVHSEAFSKICIQNEIQQKNNIKRQSRNHEEIDFVIRNKIRSMNKFKNK